MYADPAFRNRVCAAMHVVSCDVSIDSDDTGASVRVDRVQPSHGAPGIARKFTGDSTRIVQEETWTAAKGAEVEVCSPGKPGQVRGRITLNGDDGTTVQTFEGDATVNIPLVGGPLEALVAKYFLQGLDTEHRVGVAWLAGDR